MKIFPSQEIIDMTPEKRDGEPDAGNSVFAGTGEKKGGRNSGLPFLY